MASRASKERSQGPRTRQRVHKTPPPLDVPDIEEDAAERKRVLNVLAQRRYREKKREQRLKNAATNSGSSAASSMAQAPSRGPTPSDQDTSSVLSSSSRMADVVDDLDPALATEPAFLTEGAAPSTSISDPARSSWSFAASDGVLPMELSQDLLRDILLGQADFLPADSSESWTAVLPHSSMAMPTSVGQSQGSVMPGDHNSPPSHGSSGRSPSNPDPMDSYHLPVHELTLMRGVLRIADRIGCDPSELWSLNALSPSLTNTSTPIHTLPPDWQPTSTQLTMPHHPVIDLLPWPTVRERFLTITSPPDTSRPPSTKGDMAFVNLTYDVEDNAEGLRIYGEDPHDPENREDGQLLFERCCYSFDRQIVSRSNKWRALRGGTPLRIIGAS